MNNLEKCMFLLIKNQICGTSLDKIQFSLLKDEDYISLYKLSKQHDLAHMIGYALFQNSLILPECSIYPKFEKQYITAVYRYENIHYELEQLTTTLQDAKIPFIPLKGSVIRKQYPEPWMRTSCDIDILIHEYDIERATNCIVENLNYTYKGKGSHDVQLYSPNQVHLELHYSLIEDNWINKSSETLNMVWDYCHLSENSDYEYIMNDDMFYFYHIAHMAKHIQCGGCGIRPFIDLWILDHVVEHDNAGRDALLQSGELLKFADIARNLSDYWLSDGKSDESTSALENYVLYGGVYGNEQNRVEIQTVKHGSRFHYLMSRIFLPYDTIKFYYPVLQKHKWLLPFYEVRRWFRLLFRKRLKSSLHELKTIQNTHSDNIKKSEDLLSKLGL